MPYRCEFGCKVKGIVLHVFPHPNKFPDRFKAWVNLVGSKLDSLSDDEIYNKKRICDIHFTIEHRNRYKRLNALAIPTQNFPGATKPLDNTTVSTSEITTTLFSDDGPDQSDTQSVILEADDDSSEVKPILTPEQHNTYKDVNIENKLDAFPKPMVKIFMEHNYSETTRSIRNMHKSDSLKTFYEMQAEFLGRKEDNYALDKNVKALIFRKLLQDVPDSKADECWTEIVNVLNKYREK